MYKHEDEQQQPQKLDLVPILWMLEKNAERKEGKKKNQILLGNPDSCGKQREKEQKRPLHCRYKVCTDVDSLGHHRARAEQEQVDEYTSGNPCVNKNIWRCEHGTSHVH